MTDQATLTKIRRVAKDVRRWAEQLNAREDMWDEDLGCMCAIASYELYKRLKKYKLSPTICLSKPYLYTDHAFIHCQGYTIDVTATQFGKKFPKVYIAERRRSSLAIWQPEQKARTKKQLVTILRDWPDYQIHAELLPVILRERELRANTIGRI